MGSAVVEISVVPIGTHTASLSDEVARAVKVLKDAGVKYEVTGMCTVLEGEISTIMPLVEKMHDATFNDEVKRVVTTVKIDERKDKASSSEEKVRSVEEKLMRV